METYVGCIQCEHSKYDTGYERYVCKLTSIFVKDPLYGPGTKLQFCTDINVDSQCKSYKKQIRFGFIRSWLEKIPRLSWRVSQ